MRFTFDNAFVRDLPGEPDRGAYPRQVFGAAYSRAQPAPVPAPRLLAYSPEVATLVGLDEAEVRSPRFVEVFAGNALLDGMEPYSANYGGHQFGHWAGQLGDGRAITLGELVTTAGTRWELQLKGAGRTAYSRSADGRAVLRSSIREFLCSEAMYHLGVPTTRALSLAATGEQVLRDMFYDGHHQLEPGAIVCRVAPSFIRFGNFELPSSRRDVPLLDALVSFTISRDFPELLRGRGAGDDVVRAEWFQAVCERTALMVAHWMRVGFVHGVMNTDNMSILGLTIDYGPYGWVDNFDPAWTPNTTDAGGRRYAFGQQPHVAYWNLTKLAEAILPVFASQEALHAGLQHYVETFNAQSSRDIAAKLGFSSFADGDGELMADLHALLAAADVDMTIFFRRLADVDIDAPSLEPVRASFYDADKMSRAEPDFAEWLARYVARVKTDGGAVTDRRARMNAVNPKFVLRNYLAQQAIDRAHDEDAAGILELLELLRHPYDDQPGAERFAERRPDWARHRAGCSMLSCSS